MGKKYSAKADVVDSSETENEAAESDEATSSSDAEATDTADSASNEATGAPVAPAAVDPTTVPGLHARVSAVVKGLTTGPQDALFALHSVEMLTGRLKMILPTAIEAASDDLKTDLSSLLNTL